MAQQSLPSSRRKLPDTLPTQQPYLLHVRRPTPTYDANCHRPPVPMPTSWALPTHSRGPSAVNSPAYSVGPSLLSRENISLKGITRKCSPFCTILEIMVHALYSCLLLGLPMLYTSRVTRISRQVDMSMAEIKQSVLGMSAQTRSNDQILRRLTSLDLHDAPLLHKDLKYAWNSFINSLMRGWKMLNVISILLVSGIVAILQIQSGADDPFTRFSGLLSLICVLISVSYGCMYSIRFDSMRETRKAVEWTLEAQSTRTSTFWNVDILLAIPLVWLVWSALLFLVCFLSFVWRTGTTATPPVVTAYDILSPRIIISAIIALGLTCFVLIFTTFRRYGDAMDDTWNLRVQSWLSEAEYRVRQQGSRVKGRRTDR